MHPSFEPIIILYYYYYILLLLLSERGRKKREGRKVRRWGKEGKKERRKRKEKEKKKKKKKEKEKEKRSKKTNTKPKNQKKKKKKKKKKRKQTFKTNFMISINLSRGPNSHSLQTINSPITDLTFSQVRRHVVVVVVGGGGGGGGVGEGCKKKGEKNEENGKNKSGCGLVELFCCLCFWSK